MTMTAIAPRHTAAPKISTVLRTVSLALEARRQRKALKSLDASRLSDLGLSYQAAHREANRPVWDVPAHWLR